MDKKIKLNPVIEYVTSPIVFTAARMEALANRYFFEPLGLTSSTVRILILLRFHGAMNSSEILKKIGGTKSNISQRIRILDKKNLIMRLGNRNNDKRIVKLSITKKGIDVLDKILDDFKKHSLCLKKNFSPQEINNFINLFKKLNNILDNLENKNKCHSGCLQKKYN